MVIKTETNGYTIGEELETMIQRFEYAANLLFSDWEVEHFYYGSKLVMTKIRNPETKHYGSFNITANRVSFNSFTLSHEERGFCESLTHNDELFAGKLLELVNF